VDARVVIRVLSSPSDAVTSVLVPPSALWTGSKNPPLDLVPRPISPAKAGGEKGAEPPLARWSGGFSFSVFRFRLRAGHARYQVPGTEYEAPLLAIHICLKGAPVDDALIDDPSVAILDNRDTVIVFLQ
jgi:hypothetical protein